MMEENAEHYARSRAESNWKLRDWERAIHMIKRVLCAVLDDYRSMTGIVFLLAISMRIAHGWAISRSPVASCLLGDAAGYDLWARKIADGNWWGEEVFYQAPLYPYLLGAVYTLISDSLVVVRFLHALIGATSCVLIMLAARNFFSWSASLIAGALMALYAPLVFLEGLVQKSVLVVFFIALTLLMLSRLWRAPREGTAAMVGLAVGSLVLTRENAVVFVAVIAAWILCCLRAPWIAKIHLTAAFCLTFSAVTLPVVLRNSLIGGDFYLITAQFGTNFYIGNNPHADGRYHPLAPHRGSVTYERHDAHRLAEQAEGRSLSPREVSRHWARKAWTFIGNEPGTWLQLTVKKLALTFNAVELADTEDQYTHVGWSPVLRIAGWVCTFGVLAPLAVLGVWTSTANWRELAVLFGLVTVYACSVALFYVSARYRLPLVPLLVLLASGGLANLRQFCTTAPRLRLLSCMTVMFLVAVACHLPLVDVPKMRAVSFYNFGYDFHERGEDQTAESFYRHALAWNPRHLQSYNNLGLLYMKSGRGTAAERCLKFALTLDPACFESYFNLGALYVREEKWDEAKICFHRCAAIDSQATGVYYALAMVALKEGDVAAARKWLTKETHLDPSSGKARQLLEELDF